MKRIRLTRLRLVSESTMRVSMGLTVSSKTALKNLAKNLALEKVNCKSFSIVRQKKWTISRKIAHILTVSGKAASHWDLQSRPWNTRIERRHKKSPNSKYYQIFKNSYERAYGRKLLK